MDRIEHTTVATYKGKAVGGGGGRMKMTKTNKHRGARLELGTVNPLFMLYHLTKYTTPRSQPFVSPIQVNGTPSYF